MVGPGPGGHPGPGTLARRGLRLGGRPLAVTGPDEDLPSARAREEHYARVVNRQRVTVVVDDEHQGQIQAVVSQLRAEGMEVDLVLDALGMVTGTATGDLAALQSVEGVAAVEPERDDLGVGPPLPDVGPLPDVQDDGSTGLSGERP